MEELRVMWGLGPTEIGLLIFLALIFFGPKRLPELGRSLGETLQSFRKASSGEDSSKKALPQSPEE